MPPEDAQTATITSLSPVNSSAGLDRLVTELRGVGVMTMLIGFAFQGFNGGRKLAGDAVTPRINSGLVFLLQIAGGGLVWLALTSPAGELGAASPADVTFRLGRPGGLAYLGMLRLWGFAAALLLPEGLPVSERAG